MFPAASHVHQLDANFVCLQIGAEQGVYIGFLDSFAEQLPATAENKSDESREGEPKHELKDAEVLCIATANYSQGLIICGNRH